MSDRRLADMSDREIDRAAGRAGALNGAAEEKLRLRAAHRAKGGKLCYRCLALIPIGQENDQLVATALGMQPVCGDACGMEVLKQTMEQFKSPGRMPRGMFRCRR